MDYKKTSAEGYDFAKAKPFKVKGRKNDNSVAVYAQDADGICYRFESIIKAAETVRALGYSDKTPALTQASIRTATSGRPMPNGKVSHRVYGFDWHLVSELDKI